MCINPQIRGTCTVSDPCRTSAYDQDKSAVIALVRVTHTLHRAADLPPVLGMFMEALYFTTTLLNYNYYYTTITITTIILLSPLLPLLMIVLMLLLILLLPTYLPNIPTSYTIPYTPIPPTAHILTATNSGFYYYDRNRFAQPRYPFLEVIYVYVFVDVYVYVCIHVCVYGCIYMRMYVCMCVFMYVYIFICMYVCMY
jgi:hypothetical protein